MRLKKGIKALLRVMGIDISGVRRRCHGIYRHLRGRDYLCNVRHTQHSKNALLCYIVDPFLHPDNVLLCHQNQQQALVIADVLDEFGFNVDVVDFNDYAVKPNKKYDLIIDIHPVKESIYWDARTASCKNIFYITGSNVRWAVQQEQKRNEALQARRGVLLPVKRSAPWTNQEYMNRMDAAFMIGNSYNWQTYAETMAVPPVFYIPNTGYAFPHIDSRQRSARNFLFFASSGQVHKGLDLLLEVFAQQDFPFHLYICSAFKNEQDFCELYDQELYHTPNIHAIGFVDIRGDAFKQVVEACAFSLNPSCSEARMGSVVTTMSAGIIPICSRECGFDDDEVFNLADVSLDTLEKAVRTFAAKEPQWIQEKSLYAQKIVQERFQMANFRAAWTKGLQAVLD